MQNIIVIIYYTRTRTSVSRVKAIQFTGATILARIRNTSSTDLIKKMKLFLNLILFLKHINFIQFSHAFPE